ncbi:hypothetical protein ACFLQY_05460 [Verrucomicrobiota bacterium]
MRSWFTMWLALMASTAAYDACGNLLYDDVSAAESSSSAGYMNPGTYWGESVSIDAPSVATELDFHVYRAPKPQMVYGNMAVYFFELDAGDDGLLHTSDDLTGDMLGSHTNYVTVATGQQVGVSGFSIQLPTDFVYMVHNVGELSYIVAGTDSQATAGDAYVGDFFRGTMGPPEAGDSLNSLYSDIYGNAMTQIYGYPLQSIPEPSTMVLLNASLLVVFLARRYGFGKSLVKEGRGHC